MAGGKSNYLKNKILDHIFGGSDYTRPSTLYFALFTVTPGDSNSGTEVSGNNYSRVSVTNNSTNFPAASSGTKTNAIAIEWPNCTPSGWGTIVAWGCYDASTSGNLIEWGEVLPNKTVTASETMRFKVGGLVINERNA